MAKFKDANQITNQIIKIPGISESRPSVSSLQYARFSTAGRFEKSWRSLPGGLALIIISASPPIDLSPAQVFQGLIFSLGGEGGGAKKMIKLGYQIYILYNFLEN